MSSRLRDGTADPVDAILDRLASRHSCRAFDGSTMPRALVDAIIADGLSAPSSCNQQQWHFIAIDSAEGKRAAQAIAGGNRHFLDCAVLIYLCFQKGWTHDKFSVVQSVAAAAYHMMLSAHLRGFATIWNAGIGDTAKVAQLLGVPPTFEIQGALAIGRPRPGAPEVNPPRRPLQDIRSWEHFARPAASLYPVKPAEAYPYFAIRNRDNPFAVWDPQVWGWERLGDFRGYAVWNKSPLAASELRPRDEDRMLLEVAALPALPANARVVDLLPWDGVTTALLRRRFGEGIHLHVAELSHHNHAFIAEHLTQEHLSCSNVHFDRVIDGALAYEDATCDAVFASHVLEHVPVPEAMLDELRRVTKPNGVVFISVRNSDSRATARYYARMSRAQVSNAGPWRPLSARVLKEQLHQRFRKVEEFGIETDELGVARRREGRYADKAPIYAVLAFEPVSRAPRTRGS